MNEKSRILIVEDEAIVALELETTIKSIGYEVVGSKNSGEAAIKCALEKLPDLIIMDINLKGDMDGIDAIKQLHKIKDIPVVFLTAYSNEETLERAKKTSPYGYLIKPFNSVELKSTFEMALFKSRTDRKIKASESLFRAIYDENPLMIFTLNIFYKIENINNCVKNKLKYEKEDIIGQNIVDIFPSSLKATLQKWFENNIELEKSKNDLELKIYQKDKTELWVRLNFSSIDNENFERKYLLVCEDVSEKVIAQSKILKSQQLLHRILSSLNESVIICNSATKLVTECNLRTEKMFGYSKTELVDKELKMLVDIKVDFDFMVNKILSEVKNTGFSVGESTARRKNGEVFYCDYFVAIIDYRDEDNLEVILVVRDITDKKEAELKMAEYNRTLENTTKSLIEKTIDLDNANKKLMASEIELKELNSSKDKLYSIIAHDLKNPFQGLLGFSNILLEDIEKYSVEEVRYFVERIKFLTENAYSLLENLLEWSRLQTGKMNFSVEKVNLQKVISRSFNIFSLHAFRKEIKLFNEIKQDYHVFADERLLNSVIDNLVVNAIKFSNHGGKVIISAFEKDNDLVISVKDFGVGISKDDLSNLFRKDSFISNRGTDEETGTGLGLMLCKEIIEKHGGSLSISSELGKGSEFTFNIPKA